jgi:hypothetical protein
MAMGIRFGLWAAAVCLAREGDLQTAARLCRAADASGHAGRSTLGAAQEARRLVSPQGEGAGDPSGAGDTLDLIGAVEIALEALDT